MQLTNPQLEDRIRTLSTRMEPVPTATAAKLRPLDDVRAVLFDVYGTLFVSGSGDISLAGETHDGRALTAALTEIGAHGDLKRAGHVGVDLLAATIKNMHAERRAQDIEFPEVDILEVWRDVVEDLSDKDLLGVEINETTLSALALEFECRVNPVCPMPYAAEVLARLRDQELPLGIVSNAQFYTPLLFSALLGAPLDQLGLAMNLCSFSFRLLEAKPSPRLFEPPLAVLQAEYGIRPGEVVYVGNDYLNDVFTASLAGCRTVLFAGDKRSLRLREDDPRCAGLKADAVITDLAQLPELLM